MDRVIDKSSLLDSLFQCPLCNKLIHSATVINECLHRFCQLCIENYFQKTTNQTCPICQIVLIDPLQTLKSDLTYQRLVYKIFPRKSRYEIMGKSSADMRSHLTSIRVCLEYWDMSETMALPKCYLECPAGTPLVAIEKFLQVKYSIPSTFKIDLFYQSIILNLTNERLIDLCYCFNRSSSLDIRFIVSPNGYQALIKHFRPAEVTSPLKMKICRSQNSTNAWFIPQSSLPDLINSCQNSAISELPTIFDYRTICKVSPYIPESSFLDSNPLISLSNKSPSCYSMST